MTKELKGRVLENKVLTKDERMEIIKALEIVEEFEKAQIITGGRLNGRTYAYKRGLEDGKRKALEEINEEQAKVIDSSEIDIQKFTEAMKRQPLQVVNHPSEQVIQPCEDCVSRQAVDKLSKELVHTTRDKADFLCNFWERLQKLPPVTPTLSKGATNGDVIKAVFPNLTETDLEILLPLEKTWWNAPYKGVENGNN